MDLSTENQSGALLAGPPEPTRSGNSSGSPEEFSFVTNDDIVKARAYVNQLKVRIEVACTGTDVQTCLNALEEAEDLDDGDASIIGEDLISRLELHVESLSIKSPTEQTDEKDDPDRALEPDLTPLPAPPAHIAMRNLKSALTAIGAAHQFADIAQHRAADAEVKQQRQSVAARVTQLLEVLEKQLDEGSEAATEVLSSAAVAMAELLIHGFANPAARKDAHGFHPRCGSRLDGTMYRRVSLILARLMDSDDPFSVFGAAWGSGRLAALWASEDSVIARALSKPQKFCAEDALNYACLYAADCRVSGSWAKRSQAIGLSTADLVKLYVDAEPLVSQMKMSSDDAPIQMVGLLLNLIRSGGIPELAIGGAWRAVVNCVFGRPAVGRYASECGVFELIVKSLRTIGEPIDWLVFEKRRGGDARVVWATQVAAIILRAELSQTYKTDASFKQSGLIQEFIKVVGVLDALRRKRRNFAKLTVNTGDSNGSSTVAPTDALGADGDKLPYSMALYFILSALSDHSHDAEVDKLLKILQLTKEFASDAAFASELQRQYQQTLEDSRLESSRQAATARAKPVEQQARKSWDVSEIQKRDVGKAQKCYNHALALDPNNKELRAKVRVVDAARYAEKQRWRRRISKSAVKPKLDLCPRLGTATTYRPAVVEESKVHSAIKAEIREGSGHHVRGYIAPTHGWPETSRQPLRGTFERVS